MFGFATQVEDLWQHDNLCVDDRAFALSERLALLVSAGRSPIVNDLLREWRQRVESKECFDINGAVGQPLRGVGDVIRRFRLKCAIALCHAGRGSGSERQRPTLLALLKGFGYETREIPGQRAHAW